MPADDFFHARLDQMIDLHHPLAVLANRLLWPQIEAALAPAFERKNHQGEVMEINDLFDTTLVIAGGGVSAAAGRAAFADSVDGFLAVSEACIQSMPRKARNYAAKPMPSNFGACAKPLNANARSLVSCCERSRENWRRQSWGCSASLQHLNTLLGRAQRIHQQQPKDKNKLYALHAQEVECIGKGKARKPYEFGIKASIVVTHKNGLMVGAKTFPGNPYDGHILPKQLTQTQILLENAGSTPNQVIVDLGFRSVDADNPDVNIIHRGKYKSLTKPQRR